MGDDPAALDGETAATVISQRALGPSHKDGVAWEREGREGEREGREGVRG